MNDNDTSIMHESGSDYLANLIKSLGENPSAEQQKSEAVPASAQQSPPIDLFSSLLSNPELLAKLPTIIATVKPLMEAFSQSNSSSAQKAIASPDAAKGTVISSSPSKASRSVGNHAALLCALKPYLSEDRCRAIDYIIKLEKLGDVLKTL